MVYARAGQLQGSPQGAWPIARVLALLGIAGARPLAVWAAVPRHGMHAQHHATSLGPRAPRTAAAAEPFPVPVVRSTVAQLALLAWTRVAEEPQAHIVTLCGLINIKVDLCFMLISPY